MATIGFFDGVHRGHRFLLDHIQRLARAEGLATAVLTFPEHPRKLLHPDFVPRLLTTCDEKLELLSQTGVDYCILLDFTPQIAALSAQQFMQLLRNKYNIRSLLTGYDHRFGHNRSEGLEDYMRYGRELGMEVLAAPAYHNERGVAVSSSLIRRALAEGKPDCAADCLGYEYFLNGRVGSGHQIGRQLGFPTANLQTDCPDKLIPKDGVYAVHAEVGGKTYGGMLSIGQRPTLDNGPERTIEVHLFGFRGNIYGCPLRVSFVKYTRPEVKFGSIDELAERLKQDAAEISALLGV